MTLIIHVKQCSAGLHWLHSALCFPEGQCAMIFTAVTNAIYEYK